MGEPVWLVVGLGNPGPRYRLTRHNLGFLVVDEVCRRKGIALEHAPLALWGRSRSAGAVFLLPLTYMNRTGEAVAWALEWLRAEGPRLLVVYDDLDLEPGRLRLRWKGGDGGHRGMRSVLEAVGSEEVPRVRVGIGRPPPGVRPEEFVLLPLERGELPLFRQGVARAADAVEMALAEGFGRAMAAFNPPGGAAEDGPGPGGEG
ncbi:MAG: aminoacyl-tRNA hydrolase [Acetobacteraceae bacterium]|nr:aminoacyl-tRNA hydrolase [Acetobacteraceae bacterium]